MHAPFDIYCDGHKLATIYANDGIEALRAYFAQTEPREVVDEYISRAYWPAGIVHVDVSHYGYVAYPRF